MSLYTPPLFERIELFHADGSFAGYALRRCRLEPGTALMPQASQFRETVALIEGVENDILYD